MTDNFDPARLRELHEAATPGPWGRVPEVGCANYANSIYGPYPDWDGLLIASVDQNGTTDNAALIVALRNAVPAILAMAAENAALKAEVARLREVLTEASGFIGNQKYSARGEELFNSIHAALAGGDHD